MAVTVITLPNDSSLIGEVENLLLNMHGGLLPEYLSKQECELLASKYGEDWFTKLGYTEPEYKRPSFS